MQEAKVLEKRVDELEILVERVIREELRTLRERQEVTLERVENTRAEVLSRIAQAEKNFEVQLTQRTEELRSELQGEIGKVRDELRDRLDQFKHSLVLTIIGAMLGFGALVITAIWAILTFAIPR